VTDFRFRAIAVALGALMSASCAGGAGVPTDGPSAGAPGAGSGSGTGFVGNVDDFYDALAQRESSNDPTAVNTFGYLGLYQMGELAMMDAVWYAEAASIATSKNDWIGAWLAGAQANGVTSKESYLAHTPAQNVAVRRYHDQVWNYMNDLGLVGREGDELNGVTITRSGLIAACHLLGCGTVDEYLEAAETGDDEETAADAFGTTIEEYLTLFANYETAYD